MMSGIFDLAFARPLRVTIDCAMEHRKKMYGISSRLWEAWLSLGIGIEDQPWPRTFGDNAESATATDRQFFCTTLNSVSLNPQHKNDKV